MLQIHSSFMSVFLVSFIFYPLRQIALADLTIINKTDLVNEEELNEVRVTVR